MKKFCLLLLLITMLLTIIFVSCTSDNSTETVSEDYSSRFICINKTTSASHPDVYVFVDTQTRVQYVTTTEGGLTPLYDADGSILLYKGELK